MGPALLGLKRDSDDMNTIPAKQNEDQNVALVRARRRLYSKAKTYQGAVVLATLLLPVLSLALFHYVPSAKAYLAAWALLFGVCEVAIIDRWQKGLLKTAAKLQEEFDCDVLKIPRNTFLVGAYVDPEEVYRLSSDKLDQSQEKQLRDWYPVVVGKVPMHVARILCQRENLLYDTNVRKTYGRLLGVGMLLLVVVLIACSLAMQLKLDEFVLTVAAPAAPVINWAWREYFRQRDAIETLERLKSESEKLWKSAVEGIAADEAAERSRELQDGIYSHRVSSPLVFDFLYQLRRDGLEAQMNAGADRFVQEYQRSNPSAS